MQKSVKYSILFVLTLLEVLIQCYWLNKSPKLFSVIYFLAGIGIAVVPLLPTQNENKVTFKQNRWALWLNVSFLVFVFGYIIYKTPILLATIPVDYKIADMLPIMMIMSERFLQGEPVYAIIPEIWGGMQPIYLPSMWLPFTTAVAGRFDPRLVSSFFLILTVLFIFLPVKNARLRNYLSLLVFIPLAFLLNAMFIHGREPSHILTMSEEMIVVGYLAGLIWALSQKKAWLVAIFMAITVMSRYTIALWGIMFTIAVFLFENRKKSYQMVAIGLGIVFGFMWLTGAIWHLDVFLGLQGHYLAAVEDAEAKWKLFPTVERSLGLAKFWEYERLRGLHQIFLASAFVVPAASLAIFARWRNHFNLYLFGICSLKLTLVLFYNLLIIPVFYLFYVSIFASLNILFIQLNEVFDEKNKKEA